jgi:hypothetical protein
MATRPDFCTKRSDVTATSKRDAVDEAHKPEPEGYGEQRQQQQVPDPVGYGNQQHGAEGPASSDTPSQ